MSVAYQLIWEVTDKSVDTMSLIWFWGVRNSVWCFLDLIWRNWLYLLRFLIELLECWVLGSLQRRCRARLYGLILTQLFYISGIWEEGIHKMEIWPGSQKEFWAGMGSFVLDLCAFVLGLYVSPEFSPTTGNPVVNSINFDWHDILALSTISQQLCDDSWDPELNARIMFSVWTSGDTRSKPSMICCIRNHM